MVGRSFATLCCCVLFFFSTQVELAHTPNFDASALPLVKVQSKPDLPVAEQIKPDLLRITPQIKPNLPRVTEQTKPDLPPAAKQAHSGRTATSFFFPRKREKLSGILSMPVNFPASRFISWSHKMKTFLDMPVIQQNCLTTAVYFEARSESMVGQLAVAMVILNRVKASVPNSSICAVVYKGASQLNACQFSFACDGKPDIVNDASAWVTARDVAALALANDRKGRPLPILATATNYHADYVDPTWSKSLVRLTQIGRHIFYSRG
jgi:spore germination cell wall hydrolase CwlJ-like protein